MNQKQMQDIRNNLEYRLSSIGGSVNATDDDIRIALLICEVDQLRELLQAYRDKRVVDGLNGRIWDACKHYDAELLVDKLEAKQPII